VVSHVVQSTSSGFRPSSCPIKRQDVSQTDLRSIKELEFHINGLEKTLCPNIYCDLIYNCKAYITT